MSCSIVYQSQIPTELETGAFWLCLGKSPNLRNALAQRFGWSQELALQGRLHEIGRRFRQPFLDLIEKIGSQQTDQIGWWSTTLSWKVPSSDAFLLTLYLKLAHELVEEFAGESRHLLIVVEDPWLHQQLEQNLSGKKIQWGRGAQTAVIKAKASLLTLGALKRVRWALRMSLNFLRQSKAWSKAEFPVRSRGIAIYSLPQPRCLQEQNGWQDPYLNDVHTYFGDVEYCRFSPPGVLGFEKELAARQSYFWPLVLHYRASYLFSGLFAWFGLKHTEPLLVEGLRVDRLIKREWWLDVGLAAWSDFRFFHSCMQDFLATGRIQAVIYPYENQPWEKLIVMAARKFHVATIAYQHATVPSMLLSYFHGRSEARFMPLPDRVLTSGSHQKSLLEFGGTPAHLLSQVGSVRYQNLDERLRRLRKSVDTPNPKNVLVLLPLDASLLDSVLGALAREFPDGGSKDGIKFVLKPHPVSFQSLDGIIQRFPAEIATGSFDDAVKDCGTVLFQDTTAGFEAWLLGRIAVRYRAEMVLDIDPCEFLDPSEIVICNDADLRAQLMNAILRAPVKTSSEKRTNELREQVFGTVQVDRWRNAIDHFVTRQEQH